MQKRKIGGESLSDFELSAISYYVEKRQKYVDEGREVFFLYVSIGPLSRYKCFKKMSREEKQYKNVKTGKTIHLYFFSLQKKKFEGCTWSEARVAESHF